MKFNKLSVCSTLWLASTHLVFSGVLASVKAQVPDSELSYATSANSQPVSIYVLPNGDGWPLNYAMLFDGVHTDATITVTLLDATGTPVIDYPAEDIYANGTNPDYYPCPQGTMADGPTDAMGQATFSNPWFAGGSSIGATIAIGTWPQPEFQINFPDGDLFRFNSPDINGDLTVNLSDIVSFTQDFFDFEVYHYRSDFVWDGVLNLSDIVLMAQGVGAYCP